MLSRIAIEGREVEVSITPAAAGEIERRSGTLLAEMELYFSCLVRKQVRFRELAASSDAVKVNDKLAVSFRPVMTRHCGLDYEGDEPPLTDFPIVRLAAYVPHWLKLDYRNGEWIGEFGYAR